MRYRFFSVLGVTVGLAVTAPVEAYAQEADRFEVEEATIGQIHEAMLAGHLTARSVVEAYLERIEAYDKRGPSLNAIIVLNPHALERADELDEVLRRTGRLSGSLHGIPVIVKDNYDTHDLPTTAGSASLAGSIPPDDAFQVARIRAAGAIVLAKSNMAEFAFTPYETIGSALPGYSFNPYALNRVTAGSSGGTAAAVAASFGAVGLGTDTGNSIRGPSAHQALAGIRSTMGLTSRDGIVPLYQDRDIGGPMARTVTDAVRVLDVIAASDPADPVTVDADVRRPPSYMEYLNPLGLQGARIGVVRQLSNRDGADEEVLQRFEEALSDLRASGALIVDPVPIPELDTISGPLWCRRFQHDLNDYLESLGEAAPVTSLDEVIESGRYHVTIERRLKFFQAITSPPEVEEGCVASRTAVQTMRDGVRTVLAEHDLDALVYPTWSNPPRLVGDLVSPHGDNSQQLAPPTGFPAITVPMGYVAHGLPVGLQIFGDAWTEGRLIEIAFAYEQATKHRRPPGSTPPLAN
jgi:Asp-tRNA(Asn)/Glu-tRNA(Gln) amidotransferase A subunit family amidase